MKTSRSTKTAAPKKTVHFTEPYLLNPQHPVTVNLVGAGGTGSQVLTCLARMDATLAVLGHPGLHVRTFDPDTVSNVNTGRQLFPPSETGMNKAVCLVTRINHFFGNNWQAVPERYNPEVHGKANITVTCTDNIHSRMETGKYFSNAGKCRFVDNTTALYWLDFGNTQMTGQVVLGSIPEILQPESRKYQTAGKLETVTEMFDFSKMRDSESGPSCSLAEALQRQDLFINSTLAQLGCGLLWKLFRDGIVEYQGLFLNLETLKSNPIVIK